jgi:hypothetical protein
MSRVFFQGKSFLFLTEAAEMDGSLKIFIVNVTRKDLF